MNPPSFSVPNTNLVANQPRKVDVGANRITNPSNSDDGQSKTTRITSGAAEAVVNKRKRAELPPHDINAYFYLHGVVGFLETCDPLLGEFTVKLRNAVGSKVYELSLKRMSVGKIQKYLQFIFDTVKAQKKRYVDSDEINLKKFFHQLSVFTKSCKFVNLGSYDLLQEILEVIQGLDGQTIPVKLIEYSLSFLFIEFVLILRLL